MESRSLSESSAGEGEGGGFLVDRTAGRLARWLRILGLDTEYMATCDTSAIARRARQEGRTAVTRNRALSDRLGAECILLESEHLEDQIRQVVGEVGFENLAPFSRCNACNERLRPVPRESVRGRVPAYVYDNHQEFSVCPVCGRYYWQGTHWLLMNQKIERIVGGMRNGDE
jgi:uncharacterized protein with PIN domain